MMAPTVLEDEAFAALRAQLLGAAADLAPDAKHLADLLAGLSDDVLHATDVQDKVRAIERFDAQVVGPVLAALATYPAYRLLVVCDPGLAKGHGAEVPPILYALCDSASKPSCSSTTVRSAKSSRRC